MNTKILTAVGISLLAANLSHTTSFATTINLVANGGFESSAIFSSYQTLNAGSTTLTGWTISSGSIEILRTYWQPSEGLQSVDTSGNTSGKIQQAIATVPGTTYRVSFDLAGNPDGGPTVKSLLVGFGSSSQGFTFDTTGASLGNMLWSSRSWDFTATSLSSILSFENIGNTPYGAALDNVSVVIVPEPATILPIGLLIVRYGLKRLRSRPAGE